MPCRLSVFIAAALALALINASILISTEQAPADQKALTKELIAAIRQGANATVARLLDQGADPNAREIVRTKPRLADHSEGNQETLADTALMVAADAGHLQIVELLLAKGADVNGRGVAGFTPLIVAVMNHQPDIVKLLLAHGAKVNQRNDYGDTALIFAADEGQADLVELLLRRGADINGGTGWTPLMDAAYNGWEDVLKLLLKHSADPNVRRTGLMTALECALVQGNDDIASILRKAGARGRSREALRKEEEQAAREGEQEPKKQQQTQRAMPRQVLTQEDHAVIETVLLDVLARKASELFLEESNGSQVVLIDKTARGPGLVEDDQMNAELNDAQANDISLELRADLVRRNGAPCDLSTFQPGNTHIVLGHEITDHGWSDSFQKRYPKARAWVQIFLPGYSKAHDRAVLRFWIGPSPHGAAGTYFLVKEAGGWRVKWWHFAFFA